MAQPSLRSFLEDELQDYQQQQAHTDDAIHLEEGLIHAGQVVRADNPVLIDEQRGNQRQPGKVDHSEAGDQEPQADQQAEHDRMTERSEPKAIADAKSRWNAV
jgi:hypothetical protein